MSESRKVYVCLLAVHWDQDLFPDNKLGKCSRCEEMIVFRPDGPADDSGISKICTNCVLKEIEEAEARGETIGSKIWDPTDVIKVLKRMSGREDELD